MRLYELKQQILGLPDDLEVFMSSDGEGNSFRPFDTAEISKIDSDGEPIHPDCVAEYESDGEPAKEAIFLWPAW